MGGSNFCNSLTFIKIKVVRFHSWQLRCISGRTWTSTTGLDWLGWLRCTVCWQQFFSGKGFFLSAGVSAPWFSLKLFPRLLLYHIHTQEKMSLPQTCLLGWHLPYFCILLRHFHVAIFSLLPLLSFFPGKRDHLLRDCYLIYLYLFC